MRRTLRVIPRTLLFAACLLPAALAKEGHITAAEIWKALDLPKDGFTYGGWRRPRLHWPLRERCV